MNTKMNFNLKNKNQEANKKPFGFLHWILKAEALIVLFFLLFFCIISIIPSHTKNIIKYSFKPKEIHSSNEDYSYDKISTALNSNKNLSNDEKMFCIETLKDEFDDNYKYIDINLVAKKLSTLKIEYSYSKDMYIAGKYNKYSNIIYIYSSYENPSFESINKEHLFHELNHLISNDSCSLISSNPDIILECINELYTRKYYYKDSIEQDQSGYDLFMPYIYELCEIIPEESIEKYMFSGDKKYLVSSLMNIDGNIDNAYLLIDSINELWNDSSKMQKAKIENLFRYYKDK